MLSTFVLIMIGLIAVLAIALPKSKSATKPPVPKLQPLPEIELPMLAADMPPVLSEPVSSMLEADMPPVMLDAGIAEAIVEPAENTSGFESRVTSTGFQWFRPILELGAFRAQVVPVHHAVTPSASQFLVARMLGLLGVPVGFGPQGRVFIAKTAARPAPVQASRMNKRALKALQLSRNPS